MLMTRMRLSTLLLPLGVTVLTGCPKPPQPVRVDPSQVVSMVLLTGDGKTTYCPHGRAPQVGARVTMTDGKSYDTATAGSGIGGRLEISAFEWSTTWGAVDEQAQLRLPYDPIEAIDR